MLASIVLSHCALEAYVVPAPLRSRPPLRTSRISCDAGDAVAAAPLDASPGLPAADIVADPAVVTDTLLDLGVYGLIAAIIGLTLYSLVVTLQASNEQYGGWTKQDDEDVMSGSLDQPSDRLRSGARYDPVTETWTYPTAAEQAAKAKVGRAPAATQSASDEATNRYDRRMAKKRKAAEKRGGKKR